MPIVKIEPTTDRPVPYDTKDERPATMLEEMAVAANTVELQLELGAQLDMAEEDIEHEKELFRAVTENKKITPLKETNTAFAAAAFLRTYGAQIAMDAAQARAAITNKLMEIANCGDPRYELKALELLGKHSDIGLFSERSELTVNYKDAEDLEKAIRERVKRLLNATVVHEVPLGAALDDELGVVNIAPPLDAVLPESEDEGDGDS
jgi:exopolyphosphatase/pppGpp-phosphohydrolase